MATTLSIAASNPAQLEGNSGSKAFTFTVNRTGDLSGVSSVLWRVVGVGSTPANAADFLNGVLPSGTVSFAAGESSKIISVDVSGDLAIENNESFSVVLYSSTGAAIGASTAIGTILSDDLPSISLSLSQASVAEDGSNNLAYIFSRTGSTAAPLTINYIVRGTANSDDYASLPSGNIKSITFAAGASTTTLVINPTADSLAEIDETVEITLSPTTFYAISTPAAVVGTIINDDTNLAITPASISQQEGNSGVTYYTFTVTRTGILSGSSTAQWSVAGIGGNPADANDFPGNILPTGSVIFAAGETSKTITIEVNGDSIAEADESFSVILSNPAGATITTGSANGVIVNDDTNLAILPALPALVSQKEGNIGGTIFNFTVIRTGVVTGTSTASWIVAGNGDHPVTSDDFIGDAFPAGIMTFAAGETEKNIAIEIKGDSNSEANEGFRITLFNPSGATITTASSNGVIIDDDLPIVNLSLNQSVVNEDGNGNLIYVFTRTGPALDALTVYYTISGSADSNDYSGIPAGSPKSITFLAGESSISLVVDPMADALAEADETVAITLSANGDYIRETTTAVIGTIINDDTNLAISPGIISQAEGNGGITLYTFTVTRTGLLSGSSTAQWSVTGIGQPADENDFPGGVLPTGSIIFAAGESIKTITIEVNGDTIAENDETFAVTLTDPTGATITTATASGTIVNDDTNLAITPPTISQPEGNSGVTHYTFTVTRTGLLSGSSTAQWSVTGIGGQPADANDFPGGILPTGRVTFAAGETTKTIIIEVNGDSIAENDETFAVTLANPTGATIMTATANGTIVNEDTNLAIAPATISQPEGNSGVTLYTFTVTRTGLLSGSSSTQWSVAGIDGQPADANDFPGGVLPTGNVTFAAGETTKTITIDVIGDTIAENDETFAVTLTNPTGATITIATASGTIVNDDTNLAITPSSISESEGNSGATVYAFTVNRSGVVSGSSTAQWSVAGIGNNPANADDFGGSFPTGTVTFVAGETSQTITIEVSGDSIAENDETFAISLSDPSGATITTANAEGTIFNDDANLTITPLITSQSEGNSGKVLYAFTVNRIGVISGSSTAQWSVAGIGDHPADADDFGGSFPTGTITFAAGETSKIITVEVNSDIIAESDEKFTVVLSNPAGTTISTASAEGVIVNDDTNLGIVAINADQVEGNSGSKSFTFAIQRTGVLSGTSTTSWAAAGSGITPADASDFAGGILPSGTVSFAPGEASKLISIDIKGDTEIEPDETFSVTLYDSSEETPQNPTATGTIISDEPITISLALQPSSTAEDGGQVFNYTFTRNGPTDAPLTINFLISGSADPTNDYTSDRDLSSFPIGSITFKPGDSNAMLEIRPTADTTIENDETIGIELLASSEYAVGTVGPVVATIINNDQSQAALAISASDATKAEGNSGKTAYTFSVKRSGDTSGSSTAEWAVSSTQATGNDFIGGVLPSGTVSFASGDTSKTITVEINGDNNIETDESFTVTLANPTGATITTASASGTIIDDDIATTALKPISYDMLNGETGSYNYWDESYTGIGNRFQDLSPLSGGLGDLTDGVIASQNWYVREAPAGPGPYVAWLSVNPSITFNFGKNVDIDRVIVHVDDTSSNGNQSVVMPPQSIRLSMAGNTFNSGQINDPPGAQPLAYVFSGLNFHGDSLKLDLVRRTWWVFVSEVEFFGRESGPPLPTLAIVAANADQSEGDADSKAFTFTVTRTGDTSGPSSAAWAVTGSGSNPANGADFTAAGLPSGTVFFAAGETSQTISVNVNGDSSVESDESFIVTITNPTGARISNANASGSISNDDFPAISLAVAPASVTEDGTSNLVYTFTRTGPTTSALTVNYTVSGTASLGGDYGGIASTPTTKTVNFTAGSATATVTVDPTTDTEIEADEIVSLTLAAGTGYIIGTSAAVTGTISNDDPTITLAVSPATVAEDGTSNLIYTFTRTGSTTSALTVNYTAAGTASSGGDYSGIASTPTTKTVSFAAGSATATVTVDPTADTSIEADETIALTLAAGPNYFIGTTNAVVGTINNDDFPAITLILAPASVTEDGTSNLVYTFTRTGPITSALSVNYTVSGTASLGSDYSGIASTPTTKTVSFAAGSATATVTVDPSADTAYEEDESVALTLAAGTGYTIGTTTAVVGTITNDDLPAITLAVSPATVAEDGSSNLIYTFSRTGPTTSALTVNYTVAGTASLGSDYSGIATTPTTKTVSFAPGSATATVTVDPTADTEIEADETVALTLAAGTDYIIGNTNAVVSTITNDDFPAITLAVAPASVTEDGTSNLVYTFTRTGPTTSALTVNYTVAGTASHGSDYSGIATTPTTKTVSFAAGSATATVTVDPSADTAYEEDETVALTLAAGTGYTIGTTTAVVATIINDDAPPVLDIIATDATKAEGNSGSTTYTFTVNRSGDTSGSSTAQWAVSSSQATDDDFSADCNLLFESTSNPDAWQVATRISGVDLSFFPTSGFARATSVTGRKSDGIGWIANNNSGTNGTWTQFVFRQSFDLSGCDPSTAKLGFKWAADDSGAGHSSQGSWTPKYRINNGPLISGNWPTSNTYSLGLDTLVSGGFVSGRNAIDFYVQGNGGSDGFALKSLGLTASILRGPEGLPQGSITFAPGETSRTITIYVDGDNNIEADESFIVTLTNPADATIATASASGTISNDDPTITLTLAPASVTEDGTSNLIYTFTRTGSTTSALTVNYTISGTASLGGDYSGIATTPTTKTVSFAAGSATATVTVDPTADTEIEADETVALTLAAGTNYFIGTTNAVVGTITNDDFPAITLVVAPASVTEDGTSNLIYTFTRTGPTTSALTVYYTVAGTASLGSDYSGIATTPTTKTVSFAAGSATATVTVDPSADTAYEEDETVAITLAAGTGYTIGTTNAVVGTIANDDLPAITLAVSPSTVAEDGTSNLIYTFTRTGSTTSALTVNYTVAGTATIGSDYSGITAAGTTKTVTFAAGSASAIVAVDPLSDAEIESNETVALTLAAGVDYTVATTTTVVATIVNDDFPIISLAVSPATVAEDGAVNLVYIFSRTGATTSELTVAYGITGTANASDYTGATPGTGKTITFAAGSAIATLAVDPIVDASIEADETVALTLAAGVGYTVGTTAAVVGTIINDDFPIISLISSSDAVAEDASGNLVYTFSRTGPTASALTVNYDITGTADAFDYTGTTPGLGKTIIFVVGSSTAILTIDPKADITIEPDETVTIAIAAGTGYTIDTTTAVSGTIIDDDFPAISLSFNPDTVLEDGTSNLVYSFYRTGQISAPLTVYYTVGGTASIDDYSGLPDIQEITFAAGQSSVDLVVNPTADNLAEADETVSITLSANSAYKVVTGTTISGTIINDETSLAISPKFIRKTEGNIGTTAFTYTVTRTGALGESSSASWSTIGVGGQPANAADFAGSLLPSGIVRFAAGETRKNITILVSGDAIVEPNETFNVVLSNPRGATIGYGGAPVENLPLAPSTNLITGLGGSIGFGENILSANDDRSTGAIDLTSVFPFGLNFFGSTYNSIYLNNNGNITFNSPLSAYTPSPITQLTASPIIAPFYADVDTRAGSLVASPGGTSKGSNLVYWDLDPVNRQATFTWDDVGKYSWGTSPNAFQLVLKDVGLGNLQIDFRYENITWLVGDASGGTLARAGYSLGDGYTFYELPQSGTTQMSNLESSSNIGQPGLYRFTLPVVNLPSIARGLIVNDDTTVSISPSSLSYSEGASPTYLYTIIRNGDLSLQSSVAWQVHGQWGIDQSDFLGSIMPSGTVVFEPGETAKTIQVKVQDDLTVESDETFVVNLHSTVNTAIAQNNATGLILNNDFPRRTGGDIHVVTYDGLAYPFQNSGIFTLTRSNPGDLNLAVFLDWVDEAKSVSFATEVALKMENHAFHLKATWDDFFEIDYKGNTQSLANSESFIIDGIKIRRSGKSLIFVNGKNEEIHIIDQGSYFDFSYSLSPLRMGYLQGLMGNYDGNQSNDNQPSWLSSAVQISNSPFAAFIGQDDYRPSFQLPPITRRYEDIPQSVIDYVTSVLLARGITDEVLILQAAYDAWVTGDNTYLDDATDFNDSVNLVSPPPPPCFMSGTLIDTPSGEVPIETLKPGDLVLTPTGPQAIKFLGKTTRKASALKPQAKMPIRISEGSLGIHLPIRDTYCTPSHAFAVDDCLVEARALVNNESIANIEKWPVILPIVYFSIELDEHQLVWANGLLTETYYSNWTSTGFSREAWDNYSTYLDLYQESRPMNELPMPRIPFSRQLPLRIRERFKLGSNSAASGLDASREELCLTL